MSTVNDSVHLASVPLLVLFGALVSVVLASVFPRDGGCLALANLRGRADAFSVAYLEAIAKSSPADARCSVLEYAHSLAATGRHAEALQWIGRLPEDAVTSEAELAIEIAYAKALETHDPRWAALVATVQRKLVELETTSISDERREELAKIALGMGWPALAARYYDRLAEADGPRQVELLREAARWHLAAGELGRAAASYELAAARAQDGAAFAQDSLAAVAALEGAGDVVAASELLEKYATRLAEAPVLRRAVALAIAAGRVDAARSLGRLLVATGQASNEEVRAQVDREVNAGQPRAALDFATELVRRSPNSAELRRLEARLAERAGDHGLALRDWMWLAQ